MQDTILYPCNPDTHKNARSPPSWICHQSKRKKVTQQQLIQLKTDEVKTTTKNVGKALNVWKGSVYWLGKASLKKRNLNYKLMEYVGYVEVKPDKKGRGIPGRGCPVWRPEAGLDRVPQSNQK